MWLNITWVGAVFHSSFFTYLDPSSFCTIFLSRLSHLLFMCEEFAFEISRARDFFGAETFQYMGKSGIPTPSCFFRRQFSAVFFTRTSCSLIIYFFIPLMCDISAWPDLLPFSALMMSTTWYGEYILLLSGGYGEDIPFSSSLSTFLLLSNGSTEGYLVSIWLELEDNKRPESISFVFSRAHASVLSILFCWVPFLIAAVRQVVVPYPCLPFYEHVLHFFCVIVLAQSNTMIEVCLSIPMTATSKH